jgi:hypothetical protein
LRLLLSFECTLRLPAASSNLTTPLCPCRAAHDSGVRPHLSFEWTSDLASSSSSVALICPFEAAHDSGVRPYLSFEWTSALALSSGSIVLIDPFSAAHDSGVRPSLVSCFSISTLPVLRS